MYRERANPRTEDEKTPSIDHNTAAEVKRLKYDSLSHLVGIRALVDGRYSVDPASAAVAHSVSLVLVRALLV